MKLRSRSVSGWPARIIIVLCLSFLVYLLIFLIKLSFDPASAVKTWLDNNLVAEIVASVILSALFFVWKARKGFCIPCPIFGDDRQIMTRNDVFEAFDADASCRAIPEGGWVMKGNGTQRESGIKYKSPIDTLVTITARFCPCGKTPQSKYWRCGFAFRRPDNNDVVLAHFDNHNVLVCYLECQRHLTVTVPKELEGNSSILSVQLSDSEDNDYLKVFTQIDGLNYYVGKVRKGSWPWNLHIRAWSDDKRYHQIRVSEISMDKVRA